MKKYIRFNHCGPQFVVKNVTQAVKFYADVLDFGIDYINGSPPTYAVVFRDEVYIHLSYSKVIAYQIGPGAAFIAVTGVEKLWQHVQSSRAVIKDPISDQDFGQEVRFKTFTIQDPDNNILRIGEQLK